ncbi:hypothetical protein NHX12_020855 [Muraenolepis orangiensis]|uniref:TRUD domain-containing protein n=1 Tax=Muraenolepis orangiensis TaxID=630683 RepID=A0A9Q0ES89_9TELE|nr:hypothetical protein NHX12_020855 [Muraenolepis orangiensis]
MDSNEKRGKESVVLNVPECFISDHGGFTGTIKNSTKDFVVTEMDVNRRLVNTCDVGVVGGPQQVHDKTTSHDALIDKREEMRRQRVVEDIDPGSPANLDLHALLGPSVYEELERFLTPTSVSSGPNKGGGDEDDEGMKKESLSPTPESLSPSPSLSLGSFPDKHQRMAVHRAVRHHFPSLMTVTRHPEITVQENPDHRELRGWVTEAECDGFFRFVDAKVPGSSYTFRRDDTKDHRTAVHRLLSRRTKEDRSEEEAYTAFTLCKENLETLEAISYMAATLGAAPSDFSYAGIKDKRAITYQAMVVKNVSVKRLTEKAAVLERRGLRVTQVRPTGEPLRLGRLSGNHFDLVARGFVNYYGPQRFGTVQSVQSDRVGLALLKEDMVGAVRLFFTPEDGDEPHNQAKRCFLETDNAKEALALMPVSKARERLMLRALHRYGNEADGCTRAWLSLPHGMRVFYPHAYCSRVWNEAVAHRLATLGHAPRQGDLVWQQQQDAQEEDTGESNPPQIHVVSTEEERAGAYTLTQVVLPMPGNTVTYPQNAMGPWYRERLAADGLGDCRFRVTGLKLNLPGCYRHLVATPQNCDI